VTPATSTAGTQPLETTGTRDAVLRAAIARFASSPYTDVTIRGVAADAGVSAALVMKHFGSKERLFLAAADVAGHFDSLLDAPDEELARHMLTEVVAIQSWPQEINPFMVTLFMARSRDAPPEVREQLRTGFVDRLSQRLRGPDAALRAELVCAQLMGLSAMIRVLRTPALGEADPATIVERFVPAIERLLHPS
jgi:AcrR family transcriptional regulator